MMQFGLVAVFFTFAPAQSLSEVATLPECALSPTGLSLLQRSAQLRRAGAADESSALAGDRPAELRKEGAGANELARPVRPHRTKISNVSLANNAVRSIFAKDAAIREKATEELENTTGQDGSGVAFLFAYVFGTVLLAFAIGVIFWPQGPAVVCRILIYVLALSTMKLSVKFVFQECSFNFPKCVTAAHLACSAAVGFAVLLGRRWTQGTPIAVPSASELWLAIIPIALGFGLSLGANNMALVFCTASFAEIIGATTPIFSIGMLLFMRIPFNKILFAPTCLVVAGCMTSVTGGIDFSAMGFTLCLFANFGRSVKTTMQQKMLTGATKDKFEPCTLLAWTCGFSCAMMLAWSLATEGVAPYVHLASDKQLSKTLAAVGVSCVNACILNLFALFVTKDLGAVGVQLVAQAKSVLTVLGSVVLFGDSLTRSECMGFAAVLLGTFGYARMEQADKAAQAAKNKSLC